MYFVKKIILPLFFSLFLLNIVFGIGAYNENGEFIVYVNSIDFEITQEISQNPVPLNITYAFLNIEGDEKNISINEYLQVFSEFFFTYSLDAFGFNKSEVSQNSKITFRLEVLEENGDIHHPEKDPMEYDIQINNEPIELKTKTLNIDNFNSDITLKFDKEVSSFEIKNQNENVYVFNQVSTNIASFSKEVTFKILEKHLKIGENVFNITYYDIYGNSNKEPLIINIHGGEDLSLNLFTNQDDSSLSYFYYKENEGNFLEFYDYKIYYDYSSEENLKIKFNSNKEAKCRWQVSQTKISYENSDNKIESSNNKDFEFYLSNPPRDFIVVCDDPFSSDDVFLSTEVDSKKDYFEVHSVIYGDDFEIVDYSPKDIVTREDFDLIVKTNEEAICLYNNDGVDTVFTQSENKKTHTLSLSRGNGNYNFDVKCYSYLYDLAQKQINIEVDFDALTQLRDFKPEYSDSSSTEISFEVSEQNANCYIHLNEVNPGSEKQDNKKATADLYKRTYQITGLTNGVENDIFIYCFNGGGIANEFKESILYESDGPKIGGVRVEDEIYSSENYLNSYDSISIDLNVSNIIPVDKYYADLIYLGSNKTTKDYSSKSFNIGDIQNVTSIVFYATNVINNTGNEFKIDLKFDTKAPNISIEKPIVSKLKISAFDDISGIKENSLKYGFSTNAALCYPNQNYIKNIVTNVPKTALFACASVLDNAKNSNLVVEKIRDKINTTTEDEDSSDDDDSDLTFYDDNDEVLGSDLEDSSLREDLEAIEDPNFIPSSTKSNTGLYITISILLVLVTLGTSLFFLWKYRKLDNLINKYLVQNSKFRKIGLKLLREEENSENKIRQETNKITNLNNISFKSKVKSKINTIKKKTSIKNIFNERFSKEKGLFDEFKTEDNKNTLENRESEADSFESFYKKKNQ